ncbi:uracil-DNA glycosylase family protein [Cystobacter fuscus]|uniref:uracil-DNA glycosylase family protein n=1 Tax=Cystobacter fuscus TaxID=43 RepID=UPI0037BF19E4
MNEFHSFIQDIHLAAEMARDELARRDTLRPHIDTSRSIPLPFVGGGDIRLVVLGQDPTIKNEASRENIRTVLNLDKPGALRRYIEQIAKALGLELENVYATNVCKHFFRNPPSVILKSHGQNVLQQGSELTLPILQRELARFADATVVSLGEPVLSALVCNGGSLFVRVYWGYDEPRRMMSAIPARHSRLERTIYPLPHQPALRLHFYKSNLDQFLRFIRQDAERAALSSHQAPMREAVREPHE